jgi:hypothetical protein
MEMWLVGTIAGLWLAGLAIVVLAMAAGRRRAPWDDIAVWESDFRRWESELRAPHTRRR